MKAMKKYLIILLVAMIATSCVNDDTDFSDLINGGGNDTIPEEVITPIDIELDYSVLDEYFEED